MTEKELKQLYWLNRETAKLQEEVKKLESMVENCNLVVGVRSRKLTIDRIGKYVAEISEIKELIEINIKKIFFERRRVERYIKQIADSEVRLIVRLRCINGLTWKQIAEELGFSGDNAESAVRKRYKRFIRNML